MTPRAVHRQVLALIPARGGSKGIPRKNIISIAGRPLIAYTIEQAQRSQHINRVIVSTDDEEIAAVSRSFGAEVPFLRPGAFAQDLSPDIDVFRHALCWLQDHEGYAPELIVHLRPTGPVRHVELINQAIESMLQHPEADALRSVSPPIQTPYKMWSITKEGYLEPLLQVEGLPDAHSMPRQILPAVFWQNGYVDIVRPRSILQQHSMCGRTVLPFVVQEPIYELDYPETIPVVEAALKRLAAGESLADTPADSIPRHPV
jgi:CMP-N,N'-diacetyllegionaminic acid synthase